METAGSKREEIMNGWDNFMGSNRFGNQSVKLRLKGRWPLRQRRILICVMAENPDFILPLRVTLTSRITSNPLSADSDGCGDREISIGGFRHFSRADDPVRAKEPVTVPGMKSPRIGTGNVGFTEDVSGDAQRTPPISNCAKQ